MCRMPGLGAAVGNTAGCFSSAPWQRSRRPLMLLKTDCGGHFTSRLTCRAMIRSF